MKDQKNKKDNIWTDAIKNVSRKSKNIRRKRFKNAFLILVVSDEEIYVPVSKSRSILLSYEPYTFLKRVFPLSPRHGGRKWLPCSLFIFSHIFMFLLKKSRWVKNTRIEKWFCATILNFSGVYYIQKFWPSILN